MSNPTVNILTKARSVLESMKKVIRGLDNAEMSNFNAYRQMEEAVQYWTEAIDEFEAFKAKAGKL